MKTFTAFVRYREAMVADDDKNMQMDTDIEVFELLADLMKEAWIEDPNIVLSTLKKLEELSPGKYTHRINELQKRRGSPYGKGLDKPNDDFDKPHHDIVKPEADRVGDPEGESGGGGGE